MPTLPTIPVQQPITPGACVAYWVTWLSVTASSIVAKLQPTDGTFLVGNRSAEKSVKISTPSGSAEKTIVDAILAAVKQEARKTVDPVLVNVANSEPGAPVCVVAKFSDGILYRIPDLFRVVANNPAAASAYGNLVNLLASK